MDGLGLDGDRCIHMIPRQNVHNYHGYHSSTDAAIVRDWYKAYFWSTVGHCPTKWRRAATSRAVLSLKSHEGGSSSYITNILYCGVVFILLYKYITSTILLLELSHKSLQGGSGICAGVPGIGITVLVVVVGGVIFLHFLWK